MLQLSNWTCTRSLTINYYVGNRQKKLWNGLNVSFYEVLNFSNEKKHNTVDTLLRLLCDDSLCSIFCRGQQKNSIPLKKAHRSAVQYNLSPTMNQSLTMIDKTKETNKLYFLYTCDDP